MTNNTSFTIILGAADKNGVNFITGKNGASSVDTTYTIIGLEDWAAGADPAINVADTRRNYVTVSNVLVPTIASATYDASTGVLNVTGTNLVSRDGAANDIVVNYLTITGEAGASFTLPVSSVEATNATSFSVSLSGTDKDSVDLLFNKNGTSSADSTTYNLAAAEDWDAGSDPAFDIADLTGNGVTVSGIASVPDAPTIGTATAGDTQASISFSAPASNGGAAITGYTVTSSPGGLTAAGAGSPMTVTGLTNGVAYTFTVTATNSAGTGSASGASNTIAPAAAQTITFNNPGAQNFGSTPTLTATATSSLTPTFTSSTTGVCTISAGGLLSFASAGSCSIDADQAGDGTYLAAATVTQSFNIFAVVPGSPTAASATAGDTQASVAFSAPVYTGGAAITAYTVTSNPGGFAGAGGASPLVVAGLTNGVAYTFTVTATNSAGSGSPSTSSNAVTPKTPQTINFANPGSQDFGSAPTLSASASSSLTPTFSSSTLGVCDITSGGLLSFTSAGSCTINANQAGNGSYLAAAQVSRAFNVNAVVSAPPTIGAATAGNNQVSVTFTAPTFTGGSAPSSYTVTASPGSVTATGSRSPITVLGLSNGTAYTFNVTATNSVGTSPASAASNSAIPTLPNSAPTISGVPASAVAQNAIYNFIPSTSDIDGDTLSFSISNKPVWASFNTSTGALTGTPTQSDIGSHNGIVIAVTDGSLSASLSAFNITVTNVNDAPTISGTPTTSVAQDTAYSFTPSADDVDADSTLTFSVSNKPVWASFSTTTGALTGTPTESDIGNHNGIVIAVSDGSLSASLSAFNITVTNVNDAPTIGGTPTTSVDQDTVYSFTPSADDVDADSILTFSISNKPVWAQFNTATGALEGSPKRIDVGTTQNIVISVSDGELSASLAEFKVEVLSTNSAPNAADDDLTLLFSLDNLYQVDVLLNDSDPEDDLLTITAVNANTGQVSITDNKLMFTAPDNFNGTVTLNYSISDGEFSANATVSLLIDGNNPDAPKITVPEDIVANATGLLTKIDLGVATAVDAAGNRLSVSLDNGLPVFKPGKHQLYWRASDANGLSSVSSQRLDIHPLITVEKFKVTTNNAMVTVNVLLNGTAPTYPIYIPYTVSGSALPLSDHDLSDGELQITSGTSASISLNVFADLNQAAEKDIVITLGGVLNFAPNVSTRILITERNLAPTLTLTASQQTKTGLLFGTTAGPISVDAQVLDLNAGDSVTLQWLVDPLLINLSAESDTFEFDPSTLAEGVYKVALKATDDANEPLSITKEINLRIVKVLPVLGSGDSNNNLIPDNIEGLGDNNGNGIPNYLDNMPSSNILPQVGNVTNSHLLECDPGVRCGLGLFALGGQSGGVQILNGELGGLNQVPLDEEFTPVGGIFDFVIDELPTPGQLVSIVIPQIQPIPAGGTYRKFQKGRWVSFIENANNSLHSAQGSAGYCPPPGAAEWQPDLIEGYHCVQLTIEDGGPNDDDGLVNSAVSDPGGVMVLRSNNQAPQAVADSYSLQWEQAHQLNVLENDSDNDNDTLTINQASAVFGIVEISEDGQSLWYSPQLDFIGSDLITYGISDGKGGTASASVTINVYYNRAPTIGNMTVTTNSITSIDIDALHTASDADGDPINIINVDAQQGFVTFNANNVIRYTPLITFVGNDIISVQISDGRGGLSTAEITVKVTAKKSSGGSTSIGALILLILLAAGRRRNVVTATRA